MSIHHPSYWLAYLSDGAARRIDEITAIAPEVLPRAQFSRDAQLLLAAADAYRQAHPAERVVFAAAVTRWLHNEHHRRWEDLDVDFYNALADLDTHAPALLIEASPITRMIVANAAIHMELHYIDGGIESADLHTEPVRTAILNALERDWEPYIRRVIHRQSKRRSAAVRPLKQVGPAAVWSRPRQRGSATEAQIVQTTTSRRETR